MAISEMWELLKIYDYRYAVQIAEGSYPFAVLATIRKTKYSQSGEPKVVTFRCDYRTMGGWMGGSHPVVVHQTSLPNGKECFRKSISKKDRNEVIKIVEENLHKATNFRELYLKQNPEVTRTKWDLPELM